MVFSFKSITAASIIASYLVGRGSYTPPSCLNFGYIGTFVEAFVLQLILWVFYGVILYPKYLSPLRHLPGPKNDDFFMGQWNRIRAEPSGSPHREWVKIPNNGIIRYLGMFNKERLFITSPKALSEVLTTKSYDYKKPIQVVAGIGRVLGVGILLAEGDEHRFQRKNLLPAFAFRHIKDLFPIFWAKSAEATRAMTDELKATAGAPPSDAAVAAGVPRDLKVAPDETVVELREWASRATLDIIGVAGMGQDFHAIADPSSPLYQTYRTVFKPTRQAMTLQLLNHFLPTALVRSLPLKSNGQIEAAVQVIRATARDLIAAKRLRLAAGDAPDPDILSVALESRAFADDQLIDQLMTFLGAGHETTASALVWAIYLLCLHPAVQTRLRAEVRAALPSPADPDAAPVSAAAIEHLPYLNAVCAEVLRFYAPVPLTLREAAVDTDILGQRVPKGTQIMLVPWATNRDADLWGDSADEFDPGRWLADPSGGARSNYASMTFIHGPRGCIGERFSRGELACLLAAWVGRFEFGLADERMRDEGKLEIKGGATSRPANGLWTRMREVEGW